MVNRSCLELYSQWFADHSRLAYWIARRWCQRLLDHRGADYSADLLAELVQDAVCRGYGRFCKRCAREAPGKSQRKAWVAQCVIRGVRDALKQKSTFGSISSPVAVRDDCMNRCQRSRPGFTHGSDQEKSDALEQVGYVPLEHAAQRWEVEQVLQAELPERLQLSALYRAMGLTDEQSAVLQGVSARTVRNRLAEVREYLDPSISVYAVVYAAVAECIGKPRRSARALPLAG